MQKDIRELTIGLMVITAVATSVLWHLGTKYHWEGSAIEAGVGRYNPTSGAFEWASRFEIQPKD